MKGADLVTVSVAAGTVTVDDRYATFAAQLWGAGAVAPSGYDSLTALKDTHNDWSIVSGSEASGITKVPRQRCLHMMPGTN